MASYEVDGMIVDQILYWYDQPVSYLGRIQDSDDRTCLVILVDSSRNQDIFHRLRFESEAGLRGSLASGASPTARTYAMATDLARLVSRTGDEPWTEMTAEEMIRLDGNFAATIAPSRSPADVQIERWGSDHWTLLAYLRDRQRQSCTDLATMEYQRMRINPSNHLIQSEMLGWEASYGAWQEAMGTRLVSHDRNPIDLSAMKNEEKSEYQISYHDDFDCVEEFEAESLVEIISTAKGLFRMTQAGLDALRNHEDKENRR